MVRCSVDYVSSSVLSCRNLKPRQTYVRGENTFKQEKKNTSVNVNRLSNNPALGGQTDDSTEVKSWIKTDHITSLNNLLRRFDDIASFTLFHL